MEGGTHVLTVTDGTGGGSYPAGKVVAIAANPEAGKIEAPHEGVPGIFPRQPRLCSVVRLERHAKGPDGNQGARREHAASVGAMTLMLLFPRERRRASPPSAPL